MRKIQFEESHPRDDVEHVVRPVQGLLYALRDDTYTLITLHDKDRHMAVAIEHGDTLTLRLVDGSIVRCDTSDAEYILRRPRPTYDLPETNAKRWRRMDEIGRLRFRIDQPMEFAVMKAWIYDEARLTPERIAEDSAAMGLRSAEKLNLANALPEHIADEAFPNIERTAARVKAAMRYRRVDEGATWRLQARPMKSRMITGLKKGSIF